jgi:hypothetical protein
MIDYQQFCQIQQLHNQDGLHISQIAALLALDPRTVAYWLTVRPFFLGFQKFQLIESLELMRFSHFWRKLAANLLPKLPTAEETRFSFPLVNSLETKLPNLRISFQNKRTVSIRASSCEAHQL